MWKVNFSAIHPAHITIYREATEAANGGVL